MGLSTGSPEKLLVNYQIMKLPAFQFYTGDWLKDPELSMCSPSTRGIWIDAVCAMHESDQSGEISGTPEQLARVCRSTLSEMQSAIDEIQKTGVGDTRIRNGVVTLINRRMQRAYHTRLATRNRVAKHRRNGKDPPLKQEGNTPSSSSSSTSVYPQPPEGEETAEASRGERKRQRNRQRILEAP